MSIKVSGENSSITNIIKTVICTVSENYLFGQIEDTMEQEMEKDVKDVLAVLFKDYNINVKVNLSMFMIQYIVNMDLKGDTVVNDTFEFKCW